MKALVICTLFTITTSIQATDEIVLQLRDHFEKSVDQESICLSMIQLSEKNANQMIYKAYLGAYEAIWANHTQNPFEKLKTFNKGIKKLNEAVSQEPNNLEIRILRCVINKKSPSFLINSKDLESDLRYIKGKRNEITSPILTKWVNNLM